ncbi:MAG TPA: hypothetical protein VM818_11945 [Vicinamibacterales bacterium]|jgi:hypothetical protein|nr:hypothetical protein [Vicinamibacterales bacterium]
MAFEDPWFREGKTTSPLDWERRMHEQTKNPIHVWRAYQICSELMRGWGGDYRCESLPDWVLEYFDAAASAIEELFGDVEGQPVPQKIADVDGAYDAPRAWKQTLPPSVAGT